jgi:hypothetical protein
MFIPSGKIQFDASIKQQVVYNYIIITVLYAPNKQNELEGKWMISLLKYSRIKSSL